MRFPTAPVKGADAMPHNTAILDSVQDKALPTPAEAALSDALAITSAGVALLRILEELLAGSGQNIQCKTQDIMAHFLTLVNAAGVQGTLLSRMLLKETTHTAKKQSSEAAEVIAGATSELITSLQFEDHHTQLMDDVTGLLRRYRGLLEDAHTKIAAVQHAPAASERTSQVMETITSGIRLSEVRACYQKVFPLTPVE